jgi:hypothetical protein
MTKASPGVVTCQGVGLVSRNQVRRIDMAQSRGGVGQSSRDRGHNTPRPEIFLYGQLSIFGQGGARV